MPERRRNWITRDRYPLSTPSRSHILRLNSGKGDHSSPRHPRALLGTIMSVTLPLSNTKIQAGYSPPPLIDRKIHLARDLGPARDLPADHVAELFWRHGFRFGALMGEKRDEFGRCHD